MCCARRTRGTRNCGTELAIASTPVRAEQPEANALSISNAPTVSVAGASVRVSGAAGCDLTSPAMITITMAAMNSSVGSAKTFADSETPHRFTAVISASAARHSHTLAPYSDGNAAVRASMPADTPTAAFST